MHKGDHVKATRKSILTATAVATGAILALGIASPAVAGGGPGHGGGHGHGGGKGDTTSETLRKAVSAKSIQFHLDMLQRIADRNDGNRAAGTAGHEKSADYIEKLLKLAGYQTERQPFSYDKVNIDRAEFGQVTPDPVAYTLEEQFYPMDYSGEGAVDGGVRDARRHQPRGRPRVDLRLRGRRTSSTSRPATSRSSSAAAATSPSRRPTRPQRAHPPS